MWKVLLILAVIIACAALEAWAEDAILVKVNPMVILQRSDVRIEVRVKPDKRNRWLVVQWDSAEGGGGASRRQLEGEDSEVVFVFWAKELVPANYAVTATTYDVSGKQVATGFGRITSPEQTR
jgi:hypothetical protein